MKTTNYLLAFLLSIFLFSCSSDDDTIPNPITGINVDDCTEQTFLEYQTFYQLLVAYSENPSPEKCIEVKQVAQNVKDIFVECNLWEDEDGNIQDEIEEIINADCD
ncbi:MAG: hypothetical protein LAT51_04475 [Flavobacteriaceae bacterium]|nr:hypothetical protein [Flavobacteriaceae bacterium]